VERGLIPMISVKVAVRKAADYFEDLYHGQFKNVLLEEVELSDGYWLVTLGYDVVPDVFSQLSGIRRRFKVFKVNGETGEVISMKIREVEHVE
jgi:hypothetical protein